MTDSTERRLPYDERAEQGVLAALLVDPPALVRVADWLSAADFFRQAHQRLYTVMADLWARQEPCEYALVYSSLAQRGWLESVGGVGLLNQLLAIEFSAANLEHYAHRVERAAVARRLISAAGQVAKAAYDGWEHDDLAAAVDVAETAVLAADQRRRGAAFSPMRDLLADYYDQLTRLERGEVPSGVPTGFVDLDKVTGGLQPAEMIVLAARPGMGKTSLAMAITEHAARQGIGVGVFSLEMSKRSLAHRTISAAAGVDGHRLRTGVIYDGEWPRIVRALGEASQWPIYVDDTAGLTVLELRARARRLLGECPIGLFVVDYLQLAHGPTGAHGGRRHENRTQEVGEISRGVKALARELNVPFLVCAQLNRLVDARANGKPLLSDLRESGQIEQDADVVLFLWRNESTPPELVDVTIAKHRHGPQHDLQLRFVRELTTFQNYGAHYEGQQP